MPEPKDKTEALIITMIFLSLGWPTENFLSDNPFTVPAMNEKYYALRQNSDIKALKDLSNHTDRSVSQLAQKLIKDKLREFNELYSGQEERLR